MINKIKSLAVKILRVNHRRMYKNNHIVNPKTSNLKLSINGINNSIVISKNVKIKKGICRIYGNNCKLIIENDTFFENVEFWIQDDNSVVKIGKNNRFCGPIDISVIEGGEIIFGNDCLVSRNVSIVNGDSHKIFDKNGERINFSTKLLIGNHVWIGKNVNFLKNGSVGDESVIGANSLVTKDYHNIKNCIIAGHPAKIIKSNIIWKE